ncbi:MAG: hypothetical protein H0X24_02035 [Ktedonobacterales bacterium]|nr:hypothetical protein [Ktedonobacterales bacterium]
MPTTASLPHPWEEAIDTWATARLPQQLSGASAHTQRRYVTAVRRLAQLKPLHQPLNKLQEADLVAAGDLIRATPHASMHADLRALRLFLLDALERGLFGRRWLHHLTPEGITAALHSQYLPAAPVAGTTAQAKRNHLLITHAPDSRAAAVLLLYLQYGLPRPTICALQTNDLFTKDGRVYLRVPLLRPLALREPDAALLLAYTGPLANLPPDEPLFTTAQQSGPESRLRPALIGRSLHAAITTANAAIHTANMGIPAAQQRPLIPPLTDAQVRKEVARRSPTRPR